MAEQKKPSVYDPIGPKTTPVLMSKLPPDVQAALRRQLAYKTTSGEVIVRGPGDTPGGSFSYQSDPAPIGGAVNNTRGPRQRDVPVSSAADDAALLKRAGLSGRTVLDSMLDGTVRSAYTVDDTGAVQQAAHRSTMMGGSSMLKGAGGPLVVNHRSVFSDAPDGGQGGRAVGAINASRHGIKLPPKMTARGMAILDVGPALYQIMGQDIDTDFTVKMIPPQFRKPDETGKMREAVVIVNGQPFVQYEGEAFNVPGFEDFGDELASYFREHSSAAMGKNKLGADVAGTALEVRESDKQATDKKAQAGAREAAGSTGPRKGGAPTFDEEYQVGRTSAAPRLPKTDEVLRKL